MKIYSSPYTIYTKQPFGTAHGTRNRTDITLVAIEHNGLIAYGEASVPPYYQENQASQEQFFKSIDLARLLSFEDIPSAIRYLDELQEGNSAAKAAIDIALHDLQAKAKGISIRALYGVAAEQPAYTSFTIGIDQPDEMIRKVEAAKDFKYLKIKLKGEGDVELIKSIREKTTQEIFVDANQSWTSIEEAIAKAKILKDLGVVLIEQAFPKNELAKTKVLKEHAPIPIIADESIQRLSDLASIADAFDGINIKLMKCTGLHEAYLMIQKARQLGLKILLGCMTETSIGISAAAQFSSIVDWCDLDGNLLIKNDPCKAVDCIKGQLILNDLPGLGIYEEDQLLEILGI